jgi:hypothetical protein
MAKMGSGPPLFDGRNFSYWKSRMGAYLDALGPDVWNATKTGYTGTLTPEQQKWNAKARNAIIEGISDDVFARNAKARSVGKRSTVIGQLTKPI